MKARVEGKKKTALCLLSVLKTSASGGLLSCSLFSSHQNQNMSSADQDLFDAWFRFADADGDNVIGGADAVAFFSRSGLPQETLFKVMNAS